MVRITRVAFAPGRRVILISVAGLLVLRVGAGFATYALGPALLHLQDRWLLLAQLGVGALALALPGKWPGEARLTLSRRALAAILLALLVGCYLGHYAVLAGYDLSRDEQLAGFDTRIFAAGRLVWPLPAAWRGDAAALNLLFMPSLAHPAAWASTYLPMNAALRAALSQIFDPAWAGPAYTAGAAGLVWAIARRFWPTDPEPCVVALAALALSGQAVFAGMTAFAMPAHLFFNLVWLWLFLRCGPVTDAAALVVGFIATGLHQPLFHPLFAAPFVLTLACRRDWWRLVAYALGYAMIVSFWLDWPAHVTAWAGGNPMGLATPNIIARLADIVSQNREAPPLMACNLLRFCTWQAVMALPLLVAGIWAARRDPLGLALIAGLVLPVLLLAVLLAYQGYGFGYRYLHGMLGNVALLAGFGWRWLMAREPSRDRCRVVFRRTAWGSALVVLPAQALLAHGLYAPFARASARIDASGADYVIIGGSDGPYAADLVLNRPDLANRPLRLLDDEINDPDELATRLCHAPQPPIVAMPDQRFYAAIDAAFGTHPAGAAEARFASDAETYRLAGCRVVRLSG